MNYEIPENVLNGTINIVANSTGNKLGLSWLEIKAHLIQLESCKPIKEEVKAEPKVDDKPVTVPAIKK